MCSIICPTFSLKLPWLLSGVVVCLCVRTPFPLPCVCVCFSIYILISLRISKVDDLASVGYWSGWKPTRSKHSQRGDRRRRAESLPMKKLASQGRKFQVFGNSVSEKSYLCQVQTDLLYRDPRMVICPIIFPRFVEANKSGVNFLNGY